MVHKQKSFLEKRPKVKEKLVKGKREVPFQIRQSRAYPYPKWGEGHRAPIHVEAVFYGDFISPYVPSPQDNDILASY